MTEIESIQKLKVGCFLLDDHSTSIVKSLPLKELQINVDFFEGGIKGAINHLREEKSPDILIIDISNSEVPLSDLAKLAEVCEPKVNVIVVGEKNDVGLFRSLTRFGVNDYLVKPLLDSILMESLENISSKESEDSHAQNLVKSGKILAFVGSVGGIGATSTVANLGVCLSEKYNRKVAAIEMSLLSGHLPHYLNSNVPEGFAQVFEFPERIDTMLIERYMSYFNPNFCILSAEVGLLDKLTIKADAVKNLFNILSPQFHYTLVDVPLKESGNQVSQVFSNAHQLFILTDYSLLGLKETSRILQLVQNFPVLRRSISIVVNKVNLYKSGEIERSTFEETLQRQVQYEILFDANYPMQALTEGRPVSQENKGAFSEGIDTIAKSLLGMKFESNEDTGVFSHIKEFLWKKGLFKTS